MWVQIVGLVTALVIWSAEMATTQVGAALGPKDGDGLAPTDLSRVAVGSPAPDFTLESKDGVTVRWKFVEVDYQVRASNDQILAALARLRR